MNKINNHHHHRRSDFTVDREPIESDNLSSSLVNCDNKINRCASSESYCGLHNSNSSISAIDDESSINASNTNNKIVRKRNINMLYNETNENVVDNCDKSDGGVGCNDGDVIVGNAKRMKVECDGQDNNKSKMYQVSIGKKNEENIYFFILNVSNPRNVLFLFFAM
jgi:hypothetical protein